MGNKNWTAINNATPRQPGTLLPFVMLGLINSHLLPLPTSTMYVCMYATSSCKKKRVTEQITEAWSSLLLPKLSYLSKSLKYWDTYLFGYLNSSHQAVSFHLIYSEFTLSFGGQGWSKTIIKSSENKVIDVISVCHYFHGQNQTKKH